MDKKERIRITDVEEIDFTKLTAEDKRSLGKAYATLLTTKSVADEGKDEG